jgi:phosphopantetheine adenylyltransferase
MASTIPVILANRRYKRHRTKVQERVALLRNDETKETIAVNYKFDTRKLSTLATRDIIKGSGESPGFMPSDVEEYHNADLQMFDKVVKDFTERYGFKVMIQGIEVY